MNKDVEIWNFIAEKLKFGESVNLLTVAESAGSSPGRQGFKMAVAGNEMCGSIGGGVMEVALVKLAQGKRQKPKGKKEFKVQSPKSEVIEQVHRRNVANASGMICSGRQTVIVKRLRKEDLPTVKGIIKRVRKQVACRLRISNLEFQIIENRQNDENFFFDKISEDKFIYEENLGFKHNLFIVGGGHCALALSEIAAKLDFRITLFDDRPQLNTFEKNRFAHTKIILESYEKIADFVPSGVENYVVVMTLGYKFDEIVIRRLFEKNFKYFGVLGSKAKMKTLLKALEKEGFEKDKLAKIHTPVGLPINSHTPEEIAVSIAAEIIAVKNALV